MLDSVVTFIRRYVAFGDHQADTIGLWTAHTHAFDAAEVTPYLHITSVEKRSDKTRLLEVLELLVHRPWLTGRVTPAVLSRKIDAERPALLLDESDAAFNSDKEYSQTLRSILNTGHRSGGKASVCVGQGANIGFRDLSTFCPKAIAGIGKLPDTVADRSIAITLKRRTPAETVERFHRRKVETEAATLREKVASWTSTLDLRESQPIILEELDDRAADGWEPLLAIADAAGGDWPRRARDAALELSAGLEHEDQSLGIRLLTDIKGVFDKKDVEAIPSKELLDALLAIEVAPWSDLEHRPLDARRLAKTLKPYGIEPKLIRMASETPRGYQHTNFLDVWERYLPRLSASESATSATPDSVQIQKNIRKTIAEPQAVVAARSQIQSGFDVADFAHKCSGEDRKTSPGSVVGGLPYPDGGTQEHFLWDQFLDEVEGDDSKP